MFKVVAYVPKRDNGKQATDCIKQPCQPSLNEEAARWFRAA